MTGAYIVAERCPEAGSLVELDIMWPDLGFTNPQPHLAALGTVLRVNSIAAPDVAEQVGFEVGLRFRPEPDERFFLRWTRVAEGYSFGPLSSEKKW